METIFKKPKLKKQTSRNAFDVSQKRVYHVPFGAILPCYMRVLSPDDFIELSTENQFICDDLSRPAFMRLKEHINFYAVPIKQIWSVFDNFITGQDNYNSSAVEYFNEQSGLIPTTLPSVEAASFTAKLRDLSNSVDIFSFNKCANALRLLDTLEYGNLYGWYLKFSQNGVLGQDAPNVDLGQPNVLALAAYQKIYYDYFRNPKYEACDVKAYNFDDYNGTSPITGDRLGKLLEMHYAWAKKDYFTSVNPSVLPTTYDIGFTSLSSTAPNTDIFGVPGSAPTNVIGREGSVVIGGNVQNNGQFVYQSASDFPQSNVSALRFAFAYDKLLRRMREAGGTFDAQMLAQFGITPPEGRDGKCVYIGGQTNRLNASDVINTGEQDDLGFIGGNINQYSTPRGKFKYHAKEFCIVLGVYHTSLDYDYPSYSTSRFNRYRSRFDFFNPAFENLGLQALYKFELLNLTYDAGETDYLPEDIEASNKLLGYQRRYAEYKTSVDKVFGLFDFNLNVDYAKWVSQFRPLRAGDEIGPSEPIDVAPISRVFLQYNPAQFSQLVNVQYNGFWNTDPFKVHQYVHAKVISNMSPYSEVW